MDIKQITNDVERFEKEIKSAERDLTIAETQYEMKMKELLQLGLKSQEEAIPEIETLTKQLAEIEIKIEETYKILKEQFV